MRVGILPTVEGEMRPTDIITLLTTFVTVE